MRRKFAHSTVTSVRCEAKLIELADAMDIPLSDALMKGILYTAEFKLEHEPDKYPSSTHDLFLALEKKKPGRARGMAGHPENSPETDRRVCGTQVKVRTTTKEDPGV